jgi:hypothetical protein
MIDRFKILLLLVILAVLGLLFLQNQQPLALKLLCSDRNTSCWYQTASLPLAIWMAIFIFGGIITSLIWQVLHRFSYSSVRKTRYASDLYDNEVEPSDRLERGNTKYNNVAPNRTEGSESLRSPWNQSDYDKDWQSQKPTESSGDNVNPTTTASEYEIRREPENVTLSGSTYSYKFKEAENKKSPSNTPNLNKESNSTEDEDEDWI